MNSLNTLLRSNSAPDAVIAYAGTIGISNSEWQTDVAHTTIRLRAMGCRPAVLTTTSGYWFTVGLLALLQTGCEIILPPDAQALADVSDDLVVSDEPVSASDRLLLLEKGSQAADFAIGGPLGSQLAFFTSGSTGERKRIPKTVTQLEREVEILESVWGDRLGAASFVRTVPHQHVFGMTFGLLWPLISGRSFASLRSLTWDGLLRDLPGGSVIVTSPAHLHRLAGLKPVERSHQPSLILTAGAPLSFEAAQQAAFLFGSLPVEIFGSTETGAIAWRQQEQRDQIWRPLPGVTVTAGEDGALQVRSPFLATAEPLHTADLIESADGGGFRFLGRSDRIVKIEGVRISLTAVERDLLQLGWFEELVVLPVEDGGRQFLGVIAVLSSKGRAANVETGQFRLERVIRRGLASTQPDAALPRRWRFVTGLPVDEMGKRDRSLLESLLSGKVLADDSAS